MEREWAERAERVAGQFTERRSGVNLAAEVMAALAAQDLLRFGFSDSRNQGPQKGDMAKAAAVTGALAGKWGVLAHIYMVAGLLGPLCVSYLGTGRQKSTLLGQAAQGELQMAFARTGSLQAESTPRGYVLTGEKNYITGAVGADLILSVAEPANSRDMTIFLTPRGAENLSIEPLPGLAGGDAYPSCYMGFKGVRLGKDRVLGGARALGKARETLRNAGLLERLLVAAMAGGMARAASQRVGAYVNERKSSGKMQFQSIQHAVAEMYTLSKSMELFVEYGLRAWEEQADFSQAVAMAKYFNSEQLQRVAGLAVRIMGGRAYFDFEPVSHFYREAPFTLFAGGTIEMQKTLIARGLGL